MSRNVRQTVLPLAAALIWGAAFVVQSISTDYLGAFTFTAARAVIATASLLIVVVISRRFGKPKKKYDAHAKKSLFLGGACCGCMLTFAAVLQQFAIADTSAGKTAFLTALYIVMVPLIGILLGRRIAKNLLIGIAFAVAGLYCLCIKDGFTINGSDIFLLLAALGFALHILCVDHFVQACDAIELSCVQFAAEAVICTVCALLFETPSLSALYACLWPLLYIGVLSSAVAFTLQLIAQKGSNPVIVSLLLSLESLFGAISGAIFLHETLTPREILGCVLMLAATVLAQLPDRKKSKAFP